MSATEEAHEGASDHVSAVEQLITSEESTIGVNHSDDASEQRVLELDVTGNTKLDEIDVAAHSAAKESSADEESGRHSLDDIPVANQERPYEPIAKTLEEDKDNAVEAAVRDSSESLALAASEVTDIKAISDETIEIIKKQEPLHTEVAATPESQLEQGTAHDTTAAHADSTELTPDVPKHGESVIEDVARSLPQALVDEIPETHISDAPTIAEEAHLIDEVVKTNEHIAEAAPPTPEVEAHAADTFIAETEAAPAQPAEPATPEEETEAVGAVTAPAAISAEADEGDQALASPAGAVSHAGNTEILPAAAIDLKDCQTKLLVAVNARTLAKALLVDEVAPAIPGTGKAPAILAEIQPAEPTQAEPEVLSAEQDHNTLTEVEVASADEMESVIAEAGPPVSHAEVSAEPTTVEPEVLHAEDEHPSNGTEIVAAEPEVPTILEEVQAVQPALAEPEAQEITSHAVELINAEPEAATIFTGVQAVEPVSSEPQVLRAEEDHALDEIELVTTEAEIPTLVAEVRTVELASSESQVIHAEDDHASNETELITAEAEIPAEAQVSEAIMEPESLHVEKHISETVQMTATSEADSATDPLEATGEQVPTEDDVLQSETSFVEAEPVVIDDGVTLTEVDSTVKDIPSEDELPENLEEHPADALMVQTEDFIERPRSPWTPSYSVTTQGPEESDLPENPDESGLVFLPAIGKFKIVSDNVGVPEPAGGCAEDEYVIQRVGKIAQEEVETQPYQGESVPEEDVPKPPSPLAIDVSLPSLSGEEGTEERPKSPWTPSYSVTTQGNAMHDLADGNVLDQPSTSTTETIDQLANDHAETVTPTDVPVDQTDNNDHLTQPTTIPTIDITISEAPLVDSEILPDANAVEENGSAVLAESSSIEDEIVSKSPSQLTVDMPTPNLAGEEEARPKSPWTPSYSVTTQGNAMQDAAELEGLEQLPPSMVEAIDRPENAIAAEKSELIVDEPLVDVAQGEHDSSEQSALVPAIDITHSDELSQVNTKGTVEHGDTTLSQSCSFEDVGSKPPLQLVVDTSYPSPGSEQDRPKSPWTPSYSVATQGSSPHELADLGQLEPLPPNVVEPLEQQAVESVATTIHLVPSVYEAQPDDLSQLSASVEIATEPTRQGKDDVQDELASAQPEAMGSESISLVISDDIIEDRPKSPWTPSYSVITQGPGARGGLCQEDLDQLERFPEHAIGVGVRETLPFIRTSISQTEEFDNASIASDVPEPPLSPQSDLGIFTPNFDTRSEVSAASREPASPTSSRTDLASSGADEFAIPAAITRSSSSLTADRDDITPQYTPLAAFKDVPDVDSDGFMRSSELTPVNEAFIGHHNEPKVSHGESPKTLPKTLSLLRLPSVEEDAAAGVSPISLELSSATPTRKRLESTTSSRFFPGGWFSSSPIVPQEGNTRTSLDVASGEFVRRSSTESRLSTEPPVDDPISSAKVECDDDDDDDEKKARWCTIM